MTVSTETASVSYAGNGATTVFSVPYYFLENSHIRVVLRTSAGVESTKILTTDYTVSGAGTNPSTATITCVSFTPASGQTLRIVRDPPLTQDTDYVENDPFPAETHEEALDKLTMIAQAISNDVGRSLKLPETSSASALLLDPAGNGNRVLALNAGATSFVYASVATGTLTGPDYKTTSVAAMKALTGMANNAIIQTLGYYSEGDGGHGTYRYDSSSSATDNGGTVIAPNAGGGRFLLLHDSVVGVRQFGCKLDGTNDAVAFLAILQSTGFKEITGFGTLSLTATVSATLTTAKHLSGDLTIKWAGPSTSGVMVTIDCAGFDFEYSVKSDGNDLISAGWLIENSTSMASPMPKCVFKGKTTKFKANAATTFNSNAYIRGSFGLVEISDGDHSNTSRVAGIGAATQTMVVDKKTSSLYPKVIKHFNNSYSGIASADTGAADIDTDYFVVTMPDPTNFPNGDSSFNEYPPVFVESHSNKYYNPIGRAEKYQCVPFVHDIEIYRDGGRTMSVASVDINLQWGVGTVENVNVFLSSVSGSSPITTDYIPVSFYQGSTYGEKKSNAAAKNITIFNHIEPAMTRRLAGLVDFRVGAPAAAQTVPSIIVDGVTLTEGTADHIALLGFSTAAVNLRVRNATAKVTYSILGCTDSCTNVSASLIDVNNTSGTDVPGTSDSGSSGARTFFGKLAGALNYGISKSSIASGAQNNPVPLLLGATLADGYGGYGGGMTVQSANLGDDVSFAFQIRGVTAGNVTILIKTDFSGAVALLNCTGASAAIASIYETASTFSLGAGSNPDIDNRVNVWVDANGKVNIKNRLGSSRVFTVMFFG